jgi:hypothetical protein
MPTSFRLPTFLFLLSLLTAVSTSAADLKIVRVFTGWRSAASFRSIREYFGGKENDGDARVLRSQPGQRAGYYWLVRLKGRHPPIVGAKFELQVISPVSPETKTFIFPAGIPSGSCLFRIGLTGSDWPGVRAQPDAWRLSLLAADGKTLLARESYLWEMPAKKGVAAGH